MKLNSKFDVLRGWPREGALDETFPVASSQATALASGSVVAWSVDGMKAATTPDRSSADAKATWVVLEGNDDFSGSFVGKVVCLRANCMLKLDPANYAAGSYPVGTKVSYSAGQFKVAALHDQIIGEVTADDSATDGTISVYYSGGDTAKL